MMEVLHKCLYTWVGFSIGWVIRITNCFSHDRYNSSVELSMNIILYNLCKEILPTILRFL